MFRGQTDQIIDAKGRIILPVRFRDILNKKYDNTLILTKYIDNCLIAYPVEEWEEKEAEIRKLPTGKKEVRAFKRFFISAATECTVDKQGRILIPPSLKSYAQLERDIVLAGSIDHFEIWNREMFYKNITPEPNKDFIESEETQEILDKLGL